MKTNTPKLVAAFIKAHLCQTGYINLIDFEAAGMGRRTASRYIKQFMADHPDVMEYDASLKAYRGLTHEMRTLRQMG